MLFTFAQGIHICHWWSSRDKLEWQWNWTSGNHHLYFCKWCHFSAIKGWLTRCCPGHMLSSGLMNVIFFANGTHAWQSKLQMFCCRVEKTLTPLLDSLKVLSALTSSPLHLSSQLLYLFLDSTLAWRWCWHLLWSRLWSCEFTSTCNCKLEKHRMV